MKKSLLLTLACLFCAPVWAQKPPFEIDTLHLAPPYAVLVTTYHESGVYPPELDIELINLRTQEVVFQETEDRFASGFVYGMSHFNLGGQSTAIVEFQRNPQASNEGNILLLLSPATDTVHRALLRTHGYYEVLNLDDDEALELLLTEHLFHRLNVNGCGNQLHPDPRFSGKLLPRIYEWKDGQLSAMNDDLYYAQYLKGLETRFAADTERYINHYKDYSKPDVPTLLDYAQYFYLCKWLGKKRGYPLAFFKQHDKLFMYVCHDIPSRSFTLNTSLSAFFEQFGKEIEVGEK